MKKTKKKDFIPKKQAELIDFLKKFVPAFALIAAHFGFTTEEIDNVNDQVTKCEADLEDKLAKQDDAQAAAAKFKATKKSVVALVRSIAGRLKVHPDYTDETGQDLDIIGEEITIDPDTMKPELEVLLSAGIPEIKWVKNYSDGVNIYAKRGSETGFSFLARDTVSPYLDTRPNLEPGKPEDREYYAYYIFEDEEKGLESNTIKITVKG